MSFARYALEGRIHVLIILAYVRPFISVIKVNDYVCKMMFDILPWRYDAVSKSVCCKSPKMVSLHCLYLGFLKLSKVAKDLV